MSVYWLVTYKDVYGDIIEISVNTTKGASAIIPWFREKLMPEGCKFKSLQAYTPRNKLEALFYWVFAARIDGHKIF
jgi:hypothetical protein